MAAKIRSACDPSAGKHTLDDVTEQGSPSVESAELKEDRGLLRAAPSKQTIDSVDDWIRCQRGPRRPQYPKDGREVPDAPSVMER